MPDPFVIVATFGVGVLAGAIGAALIGRILVMVVVEDNARATAEAALLREKVDRLTAERETATP